MDNEDSAVGRFGPLLVAVVLLVIVGAMTFTALGFPDEARRIPLVVGTPVSAVLVVQTIRELLKLRWSEPQAEAPVATAPPAAAKVGDGGSVADSGDMTEEYRPTEPPPVMSVPVTYGWVVVLVASFYFFGMLVGVPIFITAFGRLYGREKWRTIALMVAVTLLVIQGFFVQLLEIQLHDGLLLEAVFG